MDALLTDAHLRHGGQRFRYTLVIPVGVSTPDEHEATLTHLFGGFTVAATRGSWVEDDGDIVTENSRTYTIDTDAPDALASLTRYAAWLRFKGQQDMIYLTRHPIEDVSVS